MTVLHTIDNEPPWNGPTDPGPEWTGLVAAGSSTIARTASAAWPERGSYGLRVTTVGTSAAYVDRDGLAIAVPAAGELWLGFWVRPVAIANCYVLHVLDAANNYAYRVLFHSDRRVRVAVRRAGGYDYPYTTHYAANGRWDWLVLRMVRASADGVADGGVQVFANGAPALTALSYDNYDEFTALDRLYLGNPQSVIDGFVCDFDELKIAEAYPEPYAPAPLTEYPEGRRTVVLYRPADGDSVTLAQDVVDDLGVPRANLCPLPNASADEHLPDYATFQAQVETDLAAWLGRHATVAERATTFLIAMGVPGSFNHGGVRHSATSRLCRYGSAFSSGAANPLHAPGTVERLTVTALRAGGAYLAGRIDAADLVSAQRTLTAGSAAVAVGAEDVVMTDETAWAASLPAQRLRVATAAIAADLAGAAAVFGDAGQPESYVSGGAVAAFADDTPGAAYTLRDTANPDWTCANALDAGWASAIGSADSAVVRALDVERFFEMLRLGGTLGEAVAIACPYLDDVLVAAGSPLLTASFPLAGYNVYRGLGGVEDIDWSRPVACARAGQTSLVLPEPLAPGERAVLAVRAVSAAGVEQQGGEPIAIVEIDPQGAVLGPPPARPVELTATALPDEILLGFSYRPPAGFADAEAFDILGDGGTGVIDEQDPVATLEAGAADETDFELSIPRPSGPLRLAVRARAGERAGPISETVFVPAPVEPAPAQLLGGDW